LSRADFVNDALVVLKRPSSSLAASREELDRREGEGYAALRTTKGTSGETIVTEAEWMVCADPRLQLVFLQGKASDRKARLFACGVLRFRLPFLGDERSRRVVEVAEKQADGLATQTQLAVAREAALDAKRGAASQTVSWVGDRFPLQAARMTVVSLQQAQTEVNARDWSNKVAARSRSLLHCIFGNPFRPVTINPAWLTWNDGTISKLARAIYDERAFDRMLILADALEEAGCTNADILNHCRLQRERVRGCWVVDLLLGKE
jgi:hypothetical protein